MDSNRIKFIDNDIGFNNPVPDSEVQGFMVVKAPKGTTEAMYFPANSTKEIEKMIGLPSKTYPEIQDAMDFNARFGLYISAPAGSGSYFGGMYLTKFGALQFWKETSKTDHNFLAQLPFGDADKVDATLTTESKIFNVSKIELGGLNTPFINKVSKIFVKRPDGKSIEITKTGSTLKVGAITVGIINVGNTGFDITGDASLDGFNLAGGDAAYFTNPIMSQLEVIYIIDVTSDTYISFVQKSQREVPTTLTFTEVDVDTNTIAFRTSEEVIPGSSITTSIVSGTLIPGSVDGFGANIYLQDSFPDNNKTFIEINVYKPFESTLTGPEKTRLESINSEVIVGKRAILTASDPTSILLTAFTEGKKEDYEQVRIFMEPSGNPGLYIAMSDLIATGQTLSHGILARKLSDSELNDINTVSIAGLTNKQVAIYTGEFLRKESYTSTKFYSNLIGAVGAKLCAIIQNRMGGVAPMFTDVNGLGGQLNVTIESSKYRLSKDDKSILDTKNINAITNDKTYGILIQGQKTTQTILSDWSYLGHTMAFTEFKREMRDFVMIPQIGKANNTDFRRLRTNQANSLLNRRLIGSQKIWNSGKILIEEVNTPDILAQRSFLIVARIKVDTFSEGVEMVLENVDQQTQV